MSWSSEAASRKVKTHGSQQHSVNPYSRIQGNKVRCQRLPAWAMPYTGFSTRQMRGRPSAPIVAYPGGRGSISLRQVVTRPVGRPPQNPNGACACRNWRP
eukprot:2986690-Pleurochrysis_carterae.AAC.1